MSFPYSTYNIKHKLLQAETTVLRHKNAPHTGDRYVIVMFNKNMNYAGSTECTRSCIIKAESPVQTSYLMTKESLLVDLYRKELLSIFAETNFPKDRSSTASPDTPAHSKYGTNDASLLSFGISASRKSRQLRAEAGITTRKSTNPNNSKYLRLYETLHSYLEALHPNLFGTTSSHQFQSCIVAKNSQCEWHTDKHNIGHACFTALGDYTGGELLMEDIEPPTPDYIICIPTYKRVDLFRKKSYAKVIEKYNLHSQVIMLLQNDEDEEAYTNAFPELDYLRTPAGLLPTVNFVSQYFPKNKRIIMMHDDITRIFSVDETAKRHTIEDGHTFFTDVFNRMEQEGCHLGGVYPCDYPLTMCKQPECSTNLQFIHDPLTFMINLQIPMKLEFKTDFERSVLYYKHDKKVLRMNHCTIGTAYNPKSKGGLGHRDAKAERDACDVFVKEYGEYVARIITHKNGSTSMKLKDGVVGQ